MKTPSSISRRAPSHRRLGAWARVAVLTVGTALACPDVGIAAPAPEPAKDPGGDGAAPAKPASSDERPGALELQVRDDDRLAQRRRRRRRRRVATPSEQGAGADAEAGETGDGDGAAAEDGEAAEGGDTEVRGRVDDTTPNLDLAAAASGEADEADPDRAVQPGSGNLRRSNVMEFDARLVRGETAGSGAVVLFDRGQRPLPPLTRRRKRFLDPTLAVVAGAEELGGDQADDEEDEERAPAAADAAATDGDDAPSVEENEEDDDRRERRRRRRRRRNR